MCCVSGGRGGMSKIIGKTEVVNKPLPGQQTLPGVDQGEGRELEGTVSITIRASADAVAVLKAYAKQEDLKTNRLFDEAVQLYAGVIARGLRVTNKRN